MKYSVVTDRIEVRQSQVNDKPRYIVNGTAIVANKKHVYDRVKNKDGSYKSLKNIFTKNCIESIKKQAKNKNIFVDIQHEMVRDASIKEIIKGKLNGEEQKQVSNMLKGRKIPIAKLTDLDIEDDSLKVYTELNSSYRDVDVDYKNEFDSIWYSLENKFLNGISINFGEAKIAEDEEGNKVIDDLDLLGFSYVNSPAGVDHSISEVAIRALGDGITEGEKKMADEKENLEAEKVKLEEEKKSLEVEKAAIAKEKEDKAAEDKKSELTKQEEEQKKIQDELALKTEEAKKLAEENAKLKGDNNSVKGVVSEQKPPAQPGVGETVYNEEFYKGNINAITAPHDESIKILKEGKQPPINQLMGGFSKLTNMQPKIDPTAGMGAENAAYIQKSRLMDRSDTDNIAKK